MPKSRHRRKPKKKSHPSASINYPMWIVTGEKRITNHSLNLFHKVESEIAERRAAGRFCECGGIVDSVLARLTPGEMVLNDQQQSLVKAMAGPRIFEAAGVPGVQASNHFASGGVVSPADMAPIEIALAVNMSVGQQDATAISAFGMRTETGRRVVVNMIRTAQTNKEV